MKSKILIFLFIPIIIAAIVLVLISPSYKKSFEAKYYYLAGEYDKAHRLAIDAYTLDPYNKMAINIMNQSKISESFQNYIDSAIYYQNSIKEIVDKQKITKDDKIKVKFMCEIVIGGYNSLIDTKSVDENLKKEAKEYHDWFKEVYKRVYN